MGQRSTTDTAKALHNRESTSMASEADRREILNNYARQFELVAEILRTNYADKLETLQKLIDEMAPFYPDHNFYKLRSRIMTAQRQAIALKNAIEACGAEASMLAE